MSAIVDFQYYSETYMGTEANEASFPALVAHASRMVAAMTRFRVTDDNFDSFPGIIKTMYRLAICSQIDFLALNGLDSINSTGGGGFTVGKVTVHAAAASDAGGAMSAFISPAAIAYLEQSGLMNPQVATFEGWCGGC